MAIRSVSFTLTLNSANNLPDVRNFGSMKVYTKISVRDIAGTEVQTSTDKLNGTNPKWNSTLQTYWVSQSSLREGPSVILDVKLYCQRTLGDRYVGQVEINLKKLFEGSVSDTVNMTVMVDDSQTTQGTIEFSYSFGNLETNEAKNKEKSFLGAVFKRTVSLGVKIAVPVIVVALSA